MNRCPLTYEVCKTGRYSKAGLKKLSNSLTDLSLPYTKQEQLDQAANLATKLSIEGVQPKLSARLNAAKQEFEIVERKGTFILKPSHPYFFEVPQNEDLTMRMASLMNISVPLHGMVYGSDGELSYFIKRFDRYGHNKKISIEDFSQLSGLARDVKYSSSMEKLIPIIDKYCTFPLIEKLKLFRLTMFCFLVGNDDMHLKNFALIRHSNKIEMTPAFDLLNTHIILHSTEEIALPLMGKKSKFLRHHFIDYYGKEKLSLKSEVIDQVFQDIKKAYPKWQELIQISFLSQNLKEEYLEILENRAIRLEVL